MSAVLGILANMNATGFTVFQLILAVLWQGSVILIAAAVLDRMLCGRRSSLQHVIWIIALALVPCMPLLSQLMEQTGAPTQSIDIAPVYQTPLHTIPISDGATRTDITTTDSRVPEATSNTTQSIDIPVMPEKQPAFSPSDITTPDIAQYPWALVLALYLSITGYLLTRAAYGYHDIRKRAHSSEEVDDDMVLSAFNRAKSIIGLKRPVRIAEHESICAPVATGTMCARILLPSGLTTNVSDEDLSAIALHETAHLKRYDPQTLLLITVIRALLFFHPLVWIASRRIALLAELACDDMVLDANVGAVSYARILTRLAETLKNSHSPEMAMGLVPSKSVFFRRVQAILSENRNRLQTVSKAALVLIASVGLAVVVIAASIPLGERRMPEQDNIIKTVTDMSQKVSGIVTYHGEPVKGAELFVLASDIHDIYHAKPQLAGNTTSDGTFTVTVQTSSRNRDVYGLDPILVVDHPEYAIGWKAVTNETAYMTFALKESSVVSGIVVDEQDRPLEGVTVDVLGLVNMQNNMTAPITQPLTGQIGSLSTISNSDGIFRIDRIPTDVMVVLTSTSTLWTTRSSDNTEALPAGTTNARIILEPSGTITGKVVNEDGDPMQDILIVAHGAEGFLMGRMVSRTDAEGAYEFKNASSDMYTITAAMDERGTESPWAVSYIRDVQVLSDETVSAPDLIVTRGRVITGHVTDFETGNPIVGVSVSAKHPDQNSRLEYGASITNETGEYAIRIPADKALVEIQSVPDSYILSQVLRQNISEGMLSEIANFTVKEGLTVSGRVVDQSGDPVPGATVDGEIMGGTTVWSGSVSADDDGYFMIQGLSEDIQLSVTVTSLAQKLRVEQTLDVDNPNLQVVTLAPYDKTTFMGRVLDTQGQSVSEAELEVHISYDGHGISTVMGRTDENGSYVINDILIGRNYSLTAHKEGWADAPIPLPELTPDMGPLPDAIMSPAERWIAGRVQLADGTPVAGAKIFINGSNSGFKDSVTNADGTFRFDGVAANIVDSIALRHHEYGYHSFDYLETNTSHTLTINPEGKTLSGYLVDDNDEPVIGARVILDPQTYEPGTEAFLCKTDERGQFVFSGIPYDMVNLRINYGNMAKNIHDVAVSENKSLVLVLVGASQAIPRSPSIDQQTEMYEAVSFDNGIPDLQVGQWVSGEPVDLAAKDGTIVVIDFWDSRHEDNLSWLRIMNTLYKAYRDKGVLFVGIHEYTDNADAVAEIVRDHDLAYPVAIDSPPASEGGLGATFEDFGVQYFLFDVIIGKNGDVTKDVYVSTIESTLQELLNKE